MKRSLCSVLGLMVWLAGPGPAEADCVITPVMLCAGCTVDRPIDITGGTPCRLPQRFFGGVVSTTVKVKPKHGIFAHSDASDLGFLINPGYVGTDYFEYEIVYNDRNGAQAHVNVRTTVTSH